MSTPNTEHDFGHDSTCQYCGVSVDTETVVCEVRARAAAEKATDRPLCYDCPPVGYPTDKTRCDECPRRAEIDEQAGRVE
jgi:hypothetical protein